MNQTVMDWPDELKPQGFYGLGRLKRASEKGAFVAESIIRNRIFENLANFNPVVAGTLPIAVDTVESDIDILCECSDLGAFKQIADHVFSGFDDYARHDRAPTRHVGQAVVARFTCDEIPFEIFATDCPTSEQFGFVHMVVEARILALLGDDFAQKVRALKQAGVKTEPAFAQILGLDGDPYITLAGLADLSPAELKDRLGLMLSRE
ncbi:DUF4269 domain-containing protein [Thalassospira sp.]|uniref:DUF4269 domain-containing protein n=1 Tax=Thalassospira sp. TaxID=1912094 RepID=UPI0032ECFB32